MSDIPVEFSLSSSWEKAADREDFSSDFQELFTEDGDDEESQQGFVVAKVGSRYEYRLLTPQDTNVGTLFADQVWSGSVLLANFLAKNAAELVKNKRTIEFGAGTGLPSLACLSLESELSIITDYPEEGILRALRETVGYNWETCNRPKGRVAVVGHKWGEPVANIIEAVEKLKEPSDDNTCKDNNYFDLAILSECIWMHRTHGVLVQSLDRLLHPEHGVAVVTYAHHIPGYEEQDDAFFDLCDKVRLKTEQIIVEDVEYMWDKQKRIPEYLRVLRRTPAAAAASVD